MGQVIPGQQMELRLGQAGDLVNSIPPHISPRGADDQGDTVIPLRQRISSQVAHLSHMAHLTQITALTNFPVLVALCDLVVLRVKQFLEL